MWTILDENRCYDTAYSITVEKSEGDRLGLDVELSFVEVLRIAAISQGLIHEWNEEHPHHPVMCGDLIVEVNGVSDSADSMMETLKIDRKLRITFLRASGEHHDSYSDGESSWPSACTRQSKTATRRTPLCSTSRCLVQQCTLFSKASCVS